VTAEVAVINRLAVALAADSAVTITKGDTAKVFSSDNKIFELSSTRPIGLMTYHSTQFFGVPWEIIAKDFRKGHEAFYSDDIFGWVDAFKKFLIKDFLPAEDAQKEFVSVLLQDVFDAVHDDFQDRQFALAFPPTKPKSRSGRSSRPRRPTDAEFRAEFHNSIKKIGETFDPWAVSDSITSEQASQWLALYDAEYQSAFSKAFSRFPLQSAEQDLLKDLAIKSLKSSKPGETATGLVFAGFGEKDLFPALQCIEVNGVIGGELRVVDLERVVIDRAETTAEIVPFADRDTVDSLLFNRSAEYEKLVTDHFREVIEQVGQAVVEDLGRNAEVKKDYGARVRIAAREAMERFKQDVGPEIDDLFSSDMLDIVRHMPKQEVASIAESLVSVSSIRRKVMIGPETVGGPVDVAVISRHEGFVWVKRKYYFTPDINPRYMWRAFKSDANPSLGGENDGKTDK